VAYPKEHSVICGLAVTGIDIWPIVGIGILLLVVGAIVLAIARRRKAVLFGSLAIMLLALSGLTLAPAQSASAADPCPIAVADTNSVTAEVVIDTATGNVLTNDSSPQGYALSVTNGGPAIALSHGALDLNADGSYTYTLNNALPSVDALPLGSTLTDVYTYTISDGHGGTASTTLTITINGTEQPPVANPDTNTIAADAAPDTVTGNVLSNDTDPNVGDTIRVTTTSTMSGTYGTLVIAANGSYTYTLNEAITAVANLPLGEHLDDVFNYSIADFRGGETASSTVDITITGTFVAPPS
jgi:VCBS repeat-containing protein